LWDHLPSPATGGVFCFMAIQVQIHGLEETQAKLKQTGNDLHGSPMEDGMRDATMLVTHDARINAPVDIGRLKASIAPEVRTHGNEVQGVVGSNVKYAPYQELGTGVFVGRKRHWPPGAALEVWAKRHGGGRGASVAFHIGMRGGLRPKKFLKKAFDQNKDKIVALIGKVVGKIVSK
jgi:HK97 gp10 family phage protein